MPAALGTAGSHSATVLLRLFLALLADDPGHSGGRAVSCLSLGPLGVYAHVFCFVASPFLKLLRLFSKNHHQDPDDPAFSFPSKIHHHPCALLIMLSESLPATFISMESILSELLTCFLSSPPPSLPPPNVSLISHPILSPFPRTPPAAALSCSPSGSLLSPQSAPARPAAQHHPALPPHTFPALISSHTSLNIPEGTPGHSFHVFCQQVLISSTINRSRCVTQLMLSPRGRGSLQDP